jgi:hypothetical protein
MALSELEDLRLYIQERLLLVDPTLDVTTGSALDTQFISPLIEKLGPDPYNTDIRAFILGRLETEFPDLVLQDGEPIDDYLIKPLQALLEPYRRQIRNVSTNQSFANPELLSEKAGDDLGTNFFTRRQLGGFSIGIARIYYSQPQYALITPSNPVFDGAGRRFFPVENQAITAEAMLFNLEDGLYFIDVVVRAENQGKEYDIDINTLVGIEDAPSAVRVVNKAEFEEGGDKEATETFVERTENSLTEKSLVTWKGITARLTDVFENIRFIQVIGLGDPEMDRDIIVGASTPAPYAVGTIDTAAGPPTVTELDVVTLFLLSDGGSPSSKTIAQAGVEVGDSVTLFDPSTGVNSTHTISNIKDADTLEVTPNILYGLNDATVYFSKPSAGITLSDIPGGILETETPAGEIEINSGEIHIGGMLDVFVRAGDPQTRTTNLENILDASPLHFGVDLESFGNYPEDPRVKLTREIEAQATVAIADRFGVALTTENEILIRSYDRADQSNPWIPTDEDVGRFIQLLGGNTGVDFGTFEILEVKSEEYYDAGGTKDYHRITRIKVDETTELESGSTTTPFLTSELPLDLDVCLLEAVSFKNRVRDRDGSSVVIAADVPTGGDPAIPGGIDFTTLGAAIGDSVIIETGDDAGIYSIRRILSWLATGDTLILDRVLTKTITPLGTGLQDGLRYRIADELNVDLVAPRTTKIPLGSVFSGTDLTTTAGSKNIVVTGDTNLLLAGVEIGDTLEIAAGDNKGTYKFTSVSGTSGELDGPTPNTGFNQTFSVYRAFSGVNLPLVRVKEVELLDSNSQPTGIKVPYGDAIDARVSSNLANRNEGNVLERFTGQLQDNGPGLYDLYDPNVDFAVEGIEAGYRLNLLNTLSAGSYTIRKVGLGDSLTSDNHIQVELEANGGTEFRAAVTSAVHSSIGQPSSGWVRLYFLEPTSVEILTGPTGGRLANIDDASQKFMFSEVDGYPILPAGGTDDDLPRDLRVVRTRDVGGGDFNSILELSEPTRPGVFELEIQPNDVIEVNEQLPFKFEMDLTETYTWPGGTANPSVVATGANLAWEVYVGQWVQPTSLSEWFEVTAINVGTGDVTIANPNGTTLPTGVEATKAIGSFKERGIFGKPCGLRTLAGSNLVSVLENSLIDFVSMDTVFPLGGQVLRINVGPDEGEYLIEEVVNSKTLRINAVMTATTETVLGKESSSTARDAVFIDASPNTTIQDSNDANDLTFGTQVDHKITIFESTREDFDGTYKVSDDLPSDPIGVEIEASFPSPAKTGGDWTALDIHSLGMFAWTRTESDDLVEQEFLIYRVIPTEVTVLEVATKRPDSDYTTNLGAVHRASITFPETIVDNHGNIGGKQGDAIEVLEGINAGVYWLSADTITDTGIIQQNPKFAATADDVPYRLWSGLHGSTRMLTVGPKDSSTGKLAPGDLLPYRIRRAKTYRVSSTEMQDNFDGTLYYIDIQIESEGAGDALSLLEGAKLTILSGVTVDGYTYTVDNDKLTFSPFEEVTLNFDRRFLPVGNSDSPENLTEVSGRNLQISYESSTPVRLVNDLMRSDSERPVCANPIGRHFLPSYVYFNLVYTGGLSEQEVGAELEDYINTLGGEDEIEVSDLEAFLTRRGADYVQHPLLLVTVTHDLGRNLIVDRSDNRLGGLNTVPFNGTGRIAAFFTTLGETLILVRES